MSQDPSPTIDYPFNRKDVLKEGLPDGKARQWEPEICVPIHNRIDKDRKHRLRRVENVSEMPDPDPVMSSTAMPDPGPVMPSTAKRTTRSRKRKQTVWTEREESERRGRGRSRSPEELETVRSSPAAPSSTASGDRDASSHLSWSMGSSATAVETEDEEGVVFEDTWSRANSTTATDTTTSHYRGSRSTTHDSEA
ncbi:hypothetical protein CI109_107191 [Kwoniella shandongensis]|uniref:Uncharacterized protein n=1 Tax=Kwoniella shandongensis TaxID=1734106 RepID=A0AAJ8LPT4_9TREE